MVHCFCWVCVLFIVLCSIHKAMKLDGWHQAFHFCIFCDKNIYYMHTHRDTHTHKHIYTHHIYLCTCEPCICLHIPGTMPRTRKTLLFHLGCSHQDPRVWLSLVLQCQSYRKPSRTMRLFFCTFWGFKFTPSISEIHTKLNPQIFFLVLQCITFFC